MILRILKRLGVKLVTFQHCHEVRNATACIAGILTMCNKSKKMTPADRYEILAQLHRIEKSVRYVRELNKGE